MRFRTACSVVLPLLAIACSQSTAAPGSKPDLTVEEKAIREMDARWLKAAQARDPAGEAAMFASDGVAYREHVDPLVGPGAFQVWDTKVYADNPHQTVTWTTEAIHIADSGDLAIQTGQYHSMGIGPNGEREDKGRFVTVWRKVGGEVCTRPIAMALAR
jgi:ketosteroid isomerase-like protein